MSFFDKIIFSYSKNKLIKKNKDLNEKTETSKSDLNQSTPMETIFNQDDGVSSLDNISINATGSKKNKALPTLSKEFFEEPDFDKEIKRNIDNLVASELQVAYEQVIKAETEDRPQALKKAKKLLAMGRSNEEVEKMLIEEREKARQKALFNYEREAKRYYYKCKMNTESAKQYYREQLERAQKDPDIFGFQWVLSTAHVHSDNDCKCYAYSKMDIGYGKGVFPKNQVPFLPAHLGCMCHLDVVFVWEIEESFNIDNC